MDGCKDQMAGFRGVEREAHRFRVAHFTDHQDVWILAHGVEQRLFKTRRVAPDFPLANERADRFKLIFDGMLDRDDVTRFDLVNLLNQSGECGGLAAAGRSADEDESVRVCDELLEIGMKIETFDRGLESREQSNRHADTAGSLKNV